MTNTTNCLVGNLYAGDREITAYSGEVRTIAAVDVIHAACGTVVAVTYADGTRRQRGAYERCEIIAPGIGRK